MSVDLRYRADIETSKDVVDAAIFKILNFSEVSREQGLLAVIPMLEKKALEDRGNLFEYGIVLVCNGNDATDIEDILQNVKDRKRSTILQKIVDSIYIIGVLGIQMGMNSNALFQRIDSHVPELYRSDRIKKRLTEINLKIVNEENFSRVYLRPEEATTEFEKLAALTNSQIQEIMRDVDTETIVWAIWGNEKMKGVFYRNMSGRVIEMMENDFRDIQENRILDAQKKIVVIAERLKFI
jgi:hypothetical protein